MAPIDPAASIDRANSVTRWRGSGLCLDFVDWAMGRPGSRLGDNGGPPNGSWTEAKDGYYYSDHKHPGDENPPAGVPCYWETGPSGNTAGHIVISLGNGWCRTTDYAGAASVSTQTIASITRARNGGYLGWTEDYGGNPIAGITGDADGASGDAKPLPPTPDPFDEENDMYVWTNQDVNRSYTVSHGTAKHHSDDTRKSIALKSIGGPNREIKLTDFEFATSLVEAGLGLFVDPDYKLTKFNNPAWNGREIVAPSVDGGTFLAEWDAHFGIKR